VVPLIMAVVAGAWPAGRDPAAAAAVSFNAKSVELAGVPLVRFTATGSRGLAQRQVVPALARRLGAPSVFASTICSGRLPVTVAAWSDLSVVFDKGLFAILYYNYRGWPTAREPYPPPPPVGARLKPLIDTESGVTVGDSAAQVMALDPRLHFNRPARLFTLGPNSFLVLSKRPGVTGDSNSDFVVSQIQTALGNC
jgi:hypothetical protein